ncbi:MAG: hypothetical protein MHPDNHAH_01466 [Anaerolineales bacterium]|nr:hypothetical protein [Anaerolineales bacterium]
MSNKSKSIIRAGALLLLVLALLGPWMYDYVSVPAEYTCDKPFIRLDSDFCGIPLSVIQFFNWFAIGFLFPFLTTAVLIWKVETHRLRTINLVAWALAFLLTLLLFYVQLQDQAFRLWGLWLYVLVAFGMLAVEFLAFRNSPRND